MKRFLMLAACLALTAGTAVFAQLTYSGQVQYGVLSNFDDGPGIAWDNKLVFTGKIDDFNTATLRIRMRDGNSSAAFNDPLQSNWSKDALLSSDSPFVDRAYLTTDITGALGMKGGLSNTFTTGFAYVTTADLTDGISPFEVADLDSDNFVALGGGKQAVFSNVATFSEMVNLRFAIAPNDFALGRGGWFVSTDATVDAGPGKLTPEFVFSANNGVAADKGNMVFAAKYSMSPAKDISFDVVPQYLLALDSDAFIQYAYAVAAKLGYGEMLAVSGGFLGYDGSSSNRMEARLLLTPAKNVGFDIGAVLNLDKDVYASDAGDTNILNDLDISGYVNVGKTTLRAGYLFLGEEGFSSWINNDLARIGYGGSSLKQGGVYFETTVAF